VTRADPVLSSSPETAPPALPPTSWAAPGTDEPQGVQRYRTAALRPGAQAAARFGVWALVALGALGGCVGILRPPAAAPPPVSPDADGGTGVPAPVAGAAERAVAAWLTAGDEDGDLLESLYLDPPPAVDMDTDSLTVAGVATVAAREVDDGYWAVTVAAEVVEDMPQDDDGETPDPVLATWYVEVGIVGDVERGLSALETPSIVPPPAAAADAWLPDRSSADTPTPDDPILVAVEGFLRAFLTGRGDPARYVAPGLDVPSLDPAPFAEAVVLQMAIARHDEATATVWTEVQVTTGGGARQVVAYDMALSQRAGRWEVAELPGVAAAVGTEGAGDQEDPHGERAATTSTTAEPIPDEGGPVVPSVSPGSTLPAQSGGSGADPLGGG
jgi:hypothetical protein